MSMVFRTEQERLGSRDESWRRLMDKAPIRLEGRFTGRPGGRLTTRAVGPVLVAELSVAPAEAYRSAKTIRRSDPRVYNVEVVKRGDLVVEQDGRTARLGPGDITVTDSSRPVRYVHSAAEVVSVTFPRSLMPLRQEEVGRLTATRIPGDRGTGALVSSLARQLPRHMDDPGVAEGVRLGTAVLDLVAVLLSARLDRGEAAHGEGGRRSLVTHIHNFIDERLADPALGPGVIAAEHHISVRYLHKLFEARDATVAGWIRHRRLERCRRDLLDPALRDRPVSSIGARWGFASPAHFNRVFREAYEVPPGEYRQLAAG